jgi:L-fuculose-phosphate aldolase
MGESAPSPAWKIAETYRALGEAGLTFGSSGNVSCRSVEGMIITRSGISVGNVTEDDVVAVDWDGTVHGNGIPSSEWFMHRDIYCTYPTAGAIVHAHSDACTALACLGRDLPAFHYMVAGFGGDDIRCAPYVTFGTPELGRAAVTALEGRLACLLANHGMICHGSTLATALSNAVRLEALARQYLLACSAGAPRLLTPAEMHAAHERYRSSYRDRP